jgi:GNAT superfamily N-acetyltransferase
VVSRARGVTCFLAELDGEPVAAGALNITNGVALLSGASTIPAARRRGAQLALLETRLAFAAARGIDLAMIVTQPGSASQRNAERRGFRPVYTRMKWQRATGVA